MEDNQFKVLIVDDEPEALSLMYSLIKEIDNVDIVGTADNAETALFLVVEHYPNLVFMDINMPGKTGMELVQLFRKRNIDVPVVFVSAYQEYAIEAIRSEVFDFLLKPVDRQDLIDQIEKYKRINRQGLPAKLMSVLNSIKEESKIRINSKHSYILIQPDEIVYCAAEDGYTNIFLTSGKMEVSNSSLNQIEEKIKHSNFFRLGRSLLINLDYVRSINKSSNNCTLKANDSIWEISASRKSIKELLENRYNYA